MCIICNTAPENITPTTGELNIQCDVIERIPVIPGLEKLKCDDCPRLRTIEPSDSIFELECNNCPNLENLGNFPRLAKLKLYACHSITRIQTLEDGYKLRLEKCALLETIDPQPTVNNLGVRNCPRVHTIHTFEEVESVDIDNTPSLTALPRMPELLYLTCCNAPIRTIEGYPWLRSLIITNMKRLTSIRDIPNIEECDIVHNCPMLTFAPEVARSIALNDDFMGGRVEEFEEEFKDEFFRSPWANTPQVIMGTPWLNCPGVDYEGNMRKLIIAQRQMRVALARRRHARFMALKNDTNLPLDICLLISRM
jgi:hypothetical protein